MPLPAPHLDDRTFQSLVDDAKRLVQQRCPEWTDHNVHDPGVTLIETFAYMVDQVLWRLNRVPDRTYVKFLDLLGVRLRPPHAAHAPVTFWLSAPQESTLEVPPGTQVATARTESEPVVFTTLEELPIIPCEMAVVATAIDGQQTDQSDTVRHGDGFWCFGDPPRSPRPDDCFYVGLSNAVPSCAVTLRFECPTAGVGIDPRYPPLRWEAWDGERWVGCEVDSDGTGGFNWSGDIVLHVPTGHRTHAAIVSQAAGWLRCRVIEAEAWQPSYEASPRITRVSAFTSGGTTEAVNAEIVTDEIVGEAEGVPAQRFLLRNRPVVPGEHALDRVIDTSSPQGWEAWEEVEDFAASGPDDRHIVIDATAGEIVFGPAVREQDGTFRRYGAVPPKGAAVRIRQYRTGGGQRGNVARGAISVLKSSVPFIATVTNRRPALGGTDGEDVENAKLRGPLLLRTRQRAVTTEDYENLARAAAPDIARVHCVPVEDPAGLGGVRVLVVPAVDDGVHASLEFHQLMLGNDVYERVVDYLDERRTIGARVLVQPPNYVGVTVVTRLRARAKADPRTLERDALTALYGYFHPIRGGPDGDGWPFGRAVVGGEVYSVLQRLAGVDFVEDVRLFPADPVERTREAQAERLDLGPHDLVFSWGHHVMVQTS
ncbi:MAG TPA: putative baseplate assembly protein [Acidimicrobiales bacterium]|nr:putative baseplate assembly protein [Acidimicrobiales bacterium]